MEFTQLTLAITISIIISALLTAACLQSMKLIPDIKYPVNEYRSISGARGLAAFFVYVNHAPSMLTNMGYTVPGVSQWGWIYANLGSFGVQIFFCITGFLFFDRIIKCDGKLDWNRFYESRIRRIAPLFYFACIIYLVIVFVSNMSLHIDKHDMLTISGLITFGFIDSSMTIGGFKLYPLNSVIWTLIHEWRFYFVLPLIAYTYCNKKYGMPLLVVAVAIAVVDFKNSAVVCWPYFLTGIVVAILANRKYNLSKTVKYLMAALALACFVVTSGIMVDNGYHWSRFILSSVFFACIVLANPFYMHFKPMRYLGEISYSVYLLHLPVLYLSIKAIGTFVDISNLSQNEYWLIMVMIAPVVVLVSSLSFRFIEYRYMKKK